MLTTWLRKFMGKGESKEVAKTRLRFALLCDKLDVSSEILSELQREIVEVISRYFEIEKDAVKLDIRRSEDLSLVFKTPIRGAKRRESDPIPIPDFPSKTGVRSQETAVRNKKKTSH